MKFETSNLFEVGHLLYIFAGAIWLAMSVFGYFKNDKEVFQGAGLFMLLSSVIVVLTLGTQASKAQNKIDDHKSRVMSLFFEQKIVETELSILRLNRSFLGLRISVIEERMDEISNNDAVLTDEDLAAITNAQNEMEIIKTEMQEADQLIYSEGLRVGSIRQNLGAQNAILESATDSIESLSGTVSLFAAFLSICAGFQSSLGFLYFRGRKTG